MCSVCVATRDRFFFFLIATEHNEWDEFCRMKTRERIPNSLYHFCFLFALISLCVLFRNFFFSFIILRFYSPFFCFCFFCADIQTLSFLNVAFFVQRSIDTFFLMLLLFFFAIVVLAFAHYNRNVFVFTFRVPSFSVRVYTKNIDQNAQIHPFQKPT